MLTFKEPFGTEGDSSQEVISLFVIVALSQPTQTFSSTSVQDVVDTLTRYDNDIASFLVLTSNIDC
jgi:hypothetical protein